MVDFRATPSKRGASWTLKADGVDFAVVADSGNSDFWVCLKNKNGEYDGFAPDYIDLISKEGAFQWAKRWYLDRAAGFPPVNVG